MMVAAAVLRAKAVAKAAVRSAALATMALREMSVAPAEARPMAVVIVAVRATTLMTITTVAVAVATTMAAVMSIAAATMVTAEAKAIVTAAMLLVASSGGNGGNSMAIDIRDAILLWYADIVDVRSNDNGDRAPTFDGSNIDGGVADELIKNQEGVCATQAAVVDQVAAAIATIKAPTIWRTLHLKKIAGGICYAQGWCL
jgi:hypothetical protein